MINFKIKTSFVRPEMPKAQANKTSIDFMIFKKYSWKNSLYMIFQYG